MKKLMCIWLLMAVFALPARTQLQAQLPYSCYCQGYYANSRGNQVCQRVWAEEWPDMRMCIMKSDFILLC
jgi:hypothetical protein